jgi:hypothetical protein
MPFKDVKQKVPTKRSRLNKLNILRVVFKLGSNVSFILKVDVFFENFNWTF